MWDVRHVMACLHVQAQAYAQQAAIYGGAVTAGDGGGLLDSQGAPIGEAPYLYLSSCRSVGPCFIHLHTGRAACNCFSLSAGPSSISTYHCECLTQVQ